MGFETGIAVILVGMTFLFVHIAFNIKNDKNVVTVGALKDLFLGLGVAFILLNFILVKTMMSSNFAGNFTQMDNFIDLYWIFTSTLFFILIIIYFVQYTHIIFNFVKDGVAEWWKNAKNKKP